MKDSIETKKQIIKDIKRLLEEGSKDLSAHAKLGLLSELRALEASITLTKQVKLSEWVILKSKNIYYQFYLHGFNKNTVALKRNGATSWIDVNVFNVDYRLATPSEAKQHVEFLQTKKIKSLDVTNVGFEAYKVKHDKPYSTFDPMKCDFYMVTCTGLHGSKVRHTTYGEAEADAIRIAKNRNHEAWIVGVVASVKPVTETSQKIEIKKR